MMTRLRPTLTVATIALLAGLPALAQSPVPAPDAPPPSHMMGHHGMPHMAKLTVTGEASATAEPDLAIITLGVSTEGDSAAAAMSENSTRQKAVIDALTAEGIEARDIQTSGLNLSPRMQYDNNQPPKMVGYTAQNSVTVRVRDIAGLGAVLDKLVATGANEISGISFAREDLEAAQDQARADAVKDARRRAELMAEAAGLKLGNIRALADNPVSEGPRPVMAMRAEAKADSSVPIAAGELEINARVSAVFDLLPIDAPDAPVPPPASAN
ncbi:SIMPL domain-containing protein [Paracoccus litorisediminis]|nr:SIMPL domain-containing protein [Paracoccus litorisediminis]